MIVHLNNLSGVPAAVGNYSQAVKAGGFLFCSGQIGLDPESGKMADGLEAQAHQVLKNLTAVLKGAGSSFDDVVMTSVFLADISSSKTVNEIYGGYVTPGKFPARQTYAVKDLPLGALVEISVIAAADTK